MKRSESSPQHTSSMLSWWIEDKKINPKSRMQSKRPCHETPVSAFTRRKKEAETLGWKENELRRRRSTNQHQSQLRSRGRCRCRLSV